MKHRLDNLLVERGLAESRTRAQALIMAGDVLVGGHTADKPGMQVREDAPIEVKAPLPYVSRGGLKLAHAVEVFGLRERIENKVALDIGASTGGFTDVLLQCGAARVYAVDVGTNQLAWKLRQDPRVISMEKTNIRYLESLPSPDIEIRNQKSEFRIQNSEVEDSVTNPKSKIQNPKPKTLADLATADVSYIGLELITHTAIRLTTSDAFMVFLIKPQFEAGREQVGKGGVVRDLGIHRDIIRRLASAWQEMGLYLAGLARSPIEGPAGNVEYLAHLEKSDPGGFDLEQAIAKVTG